MRPSLRAVWLKIDRAKEHRDTLQNHISETFAIDANRPRLGIKFDAYSGEYVVFVNYMPDLGDFIKRCSILTGDAVHNLVSALDHLSYQLAELNTGGNIQKPNRIQFPIADSLESFEEQKKRRLQEVDPIHVAIMERFQGYNRIDEQVSVGPYFHPLSMLRDLASTDKHRLPIALAIPTTGIQDFHFGTLGILIVGFIQQAIEAGSIHCNEAILGAEVVRAKLPPGIFRTDSEMVGYVSPMVSLPEGRSVVAVMDKIAGVVATVVREFEPSF